MMTGGTPMTMEPPIYLLGSYAEDNEEEQLNLPEVANEIIDLPGSHVDPHGNTRSQIVSASWLNPSPKGVKALL